MKNRGFGIIEIIVFLGLIALIVWGLNYITTKDFVVVRTPITVTPNDNVNAVLASTTTQNVSPTPPTTPAKTSPVASSTIATSQPKTTPTSTPAITSANAPSSSSLTVTFTDKGFSPASLTVKKGQTVTFINNSSGKMWVAANPFPSSSEYPAFNEKVGAASGVSWSFTFNNIGTWFYHNHFSPAQGAKIVVSGK